MQTYSKNRFANNRSKNAFQPSSKRKPPMNLYNVTWEIDIIARSPRDAAEQARKIMRDPDSDPSIFTVANNDRKITIDLGAKKP